MSLLVPSGRGAWVDAHQLSGTAAEIDRQLREGRPSCGWPGDPRLELTFDGPRERWIVVRHCEDGATRGIAWWAMNELDAIPQCLAEMRLDSPGRVSVEDKIDRANADIEAKASAKFRDSYGEMSEHLAKLIADNNGPRTVFRGIPGRRKD